MQQQHNKDNMFLEACWREMQDELQGVRGPCYTLQLMEELHRVQNISCIIYLSYYVICEHYIRFGNEILEIETYYEYMY